jgi:hypothetical protein
MIFKSNMLKTGSRMNFTFVKPRRWHMDMKKLAPWNWFKKETENMGKTVPVKRTAKRGKRQTLLQVGEVLWHFPADFVSA